MSRHPGYKLGAVIIGGIVFIISWLYAIASYGFFLGVGVGWAPSLMIAFIAGILWPLVALAMAALEIFIVYAVTH
jgi:hypothetical protein